MQDKIKLNIYSFITVFLWAAAFPLTKIAGQSFSPYCLGLIRCTVASVILVVLSKSLKIKKPRTIKDIILLAVAGISGFALYLIFFNTGIATITAATSSVIIAATPILTAIVCSFLYSEKISIKGWISISLSFSGVVLLLFWNGELSINPGILWTMGAAIVFCIYNLLNRKLSASGYSSVEIVTFGMISGAIIMMFCLPETVTELADASSLNIVIAICLGIFPSATSYLLWAKAIELAEKTNEVTNYMFITPLLSTIMGFILLNEIPDMGTIIGGIAIITGVILFSVMPRR